MNIRVVTDSTCDVPDEFVKRNNIIVVPNLLMMDGKSYLDGIDISRESFYNQLPHLEHLPTTGTASSGTYQKTYNDLFEQGADHIISIHPPVELSGIINAVNTAAGSFKGKVTVVDSRQTTVGMGFQVLFAATAAHEGKPLERILDLVTSIRSRLRLVAMLDTLEYVQRSGRISWAKARMASFLNLRPFIELRDGKILSLGETRTRVKGIERLQKFLEETGPFENLAILHTNALEDAEMLKNYFANQVSNETWICNVTSVIGTHVGPKALGFTAIKALPGSTPA